MAEHGRLRPLLIIVCSLAFILLGISISLNAFVVPDRAAGLWFESQVRAGRTIVALTVTQIGSDVVALGIMACVAVLLRNRSRYWLKRLLVTVCGGIVSNEVLKFVFYRKRPQFTHPLLHLHTNSFPSGHTLTATVLFGTLMLLICSLTESRGLRIAVVPLGIAMILMISISRLYLGVHYLSDVIGGILEGIVWINAVGMVLDRREKQAVRVSA